MAENLTRRYERMARQAQVDVRVPGLSVALHRADRPLWTLQVGTAGDAPLGPHHLMRMGSITKTFTAVLVLQCRDAGLLDLDDPIGAHLDVPAHGELTIRRLLSHTSGLQREPYGDVWDTLLAPDLDTMLADLARVERVLPPARQFHYSNLGFALLGHAVAGRLGGSWPEVVTDRVLTPLGLHDITVDPGGRAATGYLVDAYSDHARPETPADFGAVAPAAQLWGTAADLARWAAFLADPATIDPTGAVLAASTVDEMCWPVTMNDPAVWTVGFGLGLIVTPRPIKPGADRVLHVGHDGAMPGFLGAAYGRRGGRDTPKALGAAVLSASGGGSAILSLPDDLLDAAAEHDPPDIAAWAPGPPAPPEYRSVLGPWWSEGYEYVFRWQDGTLRAHRVGAPAGLPPAVFEPLGRDELVGTEAAGDVLRTRSGREVGERLRLTRDAAGMVIRMHWATYRFTRVQETFDGISVREP